MKIGIVVVMAILVNFYHVSEVVAWGFDGHRIIAEIAWNNLSDNARDGVKAILEPGEKMYSVSTWADSNDVRRGQYRDTYALHFLNIEESKRDVDIMRDSYAGDSVVGAISYYAMLVRSKATKNDNRNKALKWLIHFVGDVHQPMHVSYKSDRGGNDIRVKWEGETENLHSLWDSLMIDRKMGSSGWEAYSENLGSEIRDQERDKWDDNDPLLWAKESFALSLSQGYDEVSRRLPTTISDAYYEENILIVEELLKMAGVRLAGILNRIFE